MNVITTGDPLNAAKCRVFPSWSRNLVSGTTSPGFRSSKPDEAVGGFGTSAGGFSRGAMPTFLIAARRAPLEKTTSFALIKSPGASSSSAFASATSYGIVIAGMKPAISSCFTVTSLRGRSSDCTWPCNVNVRCSGGLLQATKASARARDKTREARISSSVDDLDRHIRLQLPGMEGQLLSGRSVRRQDAAVLCRAISDRRDQLHVLPDAERENRVGLGGADAVAL